jgi:hypothetical protein
MVLDIPGIITGFVDKIFEVQVLVVTLNTVAEGLTPIAWRLFSGI